ncbi:MAG: hypothetical protein R2834_10180 [Rhodothermales bacterium]
MIYLTAQLLLFLLLAALLGFAIGWMARGAFAIATRIQHLPAAFLADRPFSSSLRAAPEDEGDGGQGSR